MNPNENPAPIESEPKKSAFTKIVERLRTNWQERKLKTKEDNHSDMYTVLCESMYGPDIASQSGRVARLDQSIGNTKIPSTVDSLMEMYQNVTKLYDKNTADTFAYMILHMPNLAPELVIRACFALAESLPAKQGSSGFVRPPKTPLDIRAEMMSRTMGGTMPSSAKDETALIQEVFRKKLGKNLARIMALAPAPETEEASE